MYWNECKTKSEMKNINPNAIHQLEFVGQLKDPDNFNDLTKRSKAKDFSRKCNGFIKDGKL